MSNNNKVLPIDDPLHWSWNDIFVKAAKRARMAEHAKTLTFSDGFLRSIEPLYREQFGHSFRPGMRVKSKETGRLGTVVSPNPNDLRRVQVRYDGAPLKLLCEPANLEPIT